MRPLADIACLGFTTITSTAVLFAKTTLHMSASSLIIIGTLTPAAGIIGSLAWPRLQRRLGWSNLRALVGLVALAAVIPSYGCLGFLPFLGKGNEGGVSTTALRFGGLTSPAEMYVLAVYFGRLGTGSVWGGVLMNIYDMQDRCMARSRAMREQYSRNSSHQGKKHDGEQFPLWLLWWC